MVTRFIARSRFALLGIFFATSLGIASAQSGSFSFTMYDSAGHNLGTISGPKQTTTGTCGTNNVPYTETIYTFEAWQMVSPSAQVNGAGQPIPAPPATYYPPYQGGGGISGQSAYFGGGGEAGCPTNGWSVSLPYNLPFTEGCAIPYPTPTGPGNPCTNAWQGHGVNFNGTSAIYY